jgi:hypothetical protein
MCAKENEENRSENTKNWLKTAYFRAIAATLRRSENGLASVLVTRRRALTGQLGLNESARLPPLYRAPLPTARKGRPMSATDPEKFAQAFSDLTNALQVALGLAAERATVARTEAAESDQLHAAIVKAAKAAHLLRPSNREEGR